jgi:azurin
MKIPFVLLSTVFTAFVVTGCGKKEATTADAGAPASSPAPAASAPAAPAAARAVEITAGDNMKFNLATIDAKAGEELKVTLTNIGTLPKEAMGHNWVLLKKGVDAAAFCTAAMTAKDTDYIPAGMKDQIIAHTELIGPRKSTEVTFKVPAEPGEYVFVCSFPAHFMAGMKGTLVVK